MLGRPSSNNWSPLPGEYTDGNTGLLQEIQALSRALSLPRPGNPKPKTTPSSSSSHKKTSFWNWKPFKALSHIGQRRFDCLFSLHVHSIENLPAAVADAVLSVNWKRASDPPSSATGTSPVHAFQGVAEFDETLTYRCSVYGSGNSAAKYEARQFEIYVSVPNAPLLDFGKQLVDVTRLLPLTLEALEDAENSSGKWSTSFRLSGPGKGASLNVSFGFSFIGDNNERKMVDPLNLKLSDESSVGKDRNKSRRWARSQSVDDVRELHEVLPSSKSDVSSLSDIVEKMEMANCEIGELSDFKLGSIPNLREFCEDDEVIKPKPSALIDNFERNYLDELEEAGFVTSDQGVENSAEDQPSPSMFEKNDLQDVDEGGQLVSDEVEGSGDINGDNKASRLPHENDSPGIKDEEFEFDVLPVSEREDCSAVQSGTMAPNPTEDEERNVTTNSSFSFMDSREFGLRSDSDPESPRERLWKQFEEETLGAGGLLFGPAVDANLDDKPREEDDPSEDFDFSHLVHEAEKELLNCASHAGSAKLFEDAESEALMREWGINEKAFQCSRPPESSNGGGGLIDCPSQMAAKLSPLGDGLGPFLRTRDGGFLRSMSPSLFRNSKNNASLIMQVSSPVVVPAEMGHGVMEILRRLASVGFEKLSAQAKNLMPLEDVAGKTMQQIAWEATSGEDAFNGETDAAISQNISRGKKEENLNLDLSNAFDRVSEYVSVEDLGPLAMDKIEALCIDGLRIQSGMYGEEAPSNVSSQFLGSMSALEGKISVDDSLLDLEGTAGLQLLDVKGKADDADGLMSLSITLDEWLRLDSGILDDEDQNSDRTSKILAAHRGRTEGKWSGGRWGLLGSNFTAALMVQLRDPLRSFDPVGTPMLALVQVERIFVPLKPKIFAVVSERGKCEEDKPDPLENTRNNEEKETRQFMITKVHVAGLRAEPNEKRIWGNQTQQKSGSRWLLANGMGKSIKHPFMKSKASSVTAKAQTGSALWSISSSFHGAGSKWKEMPAVNPHIRNPNINFPKRW
ncbi:hypothetical protein KSP40_PGU003188 [Platanthera guangdongensis]|uniref:C2 NT-type domain-containing protein n=1 Tax=Platanthera guangdongensis TaxID=2320717 RepID=A0ABR2M337_9ASPA